MVAVDYFTKWVETRAMPTGTAPDVAGFVVEQIYLRHWSPETIVTDRGRCFIAELFQEVTRLLSTNHKTTSAFHPSSNVQVERMNHVLADMLSMYVSSDHRDWDEVLPYVCFAYNTSRQESTGFSPFFLMYGREPLLPSDLNLGIGGIITNESAEPTENRYPIRASGTGTGSLDRDRESPTTRSRRGRRNQRPLRNRRPPLRYGLALLAQLFLLLTAAGEPPASDLVVRGSVAFLEKGQVAFSESTWTIVTELATRPALSMLERLDFWLRDLKPYVGDNKFQIMTQEYIKARKQ
ncbi:uncharacterized protein LOC132087992 [Daphnia carinata]|uniref:uncharacterized protein LOC132087992 n=1 Tax=Daphnia carinata TaxID=120202 RepID=UPI00286932B6|nr:uncharacterized protein LOC132087992 [Daphnia carinata]